MKTTTCNIQTRLTLMVMLLFTTLANAQHNGHDDDHFKVGFNFNTYVNGDGHGGFYNMTGVIQSHRNSFSLGPTWQKAKKEFTGMRFSYSYAVIGASRSCNSKNDQFDKRDELSFFVACSYNRGAVLSKVTLENEGHLTTEQLNHYQSLRLTTIEAFVGMNYSYFLTENIKIRSFIGIGVYNHLNYCEPTYHDKMAPVLMTGVGIGFIK
jgi:hypothetical protein